MKDKDINSEIEVEVMYTQPPPPFFQEFFGWVAPPPPHCQKWCYLPAMLCLLYVDVFNNHFTLNYCSLRFAGCPNLHVDMLVSKQDTCLDEFSDELCDSYLKKCFVYKSNRGIQSV